MNSIMFSLGSIHIYWYSVMILLAIIIGIYLAIKEAKRIKVDLAFINDLIFYLIPVSIIGARLYYVIFNFKFYQNNLLSVLYIWQGGLAIYGGIIAAIIFTLFYCHKKNQNFFRITDLLVPSLILGQAIGRWGNFFNKEAYGPIVTKKILEMIRIPKFIIDGMYINGSYYHPTFLYESLWCFFGFMILIYLQKNVKKLKVGAILATYFIWYGIGRLVIENFRQDSLYLGTIRISQLVSIVLIIVGIIILIVNRKKRVYYDKI